MGVGGATIAIGMEAGEGRWRFRKCASTRRNLRRSSFPTQVLRMPIRMASSSLDTCVFACFTDNHLPCFFNRVASALLAVYERVAVRADRHEVLRRVSLPLVPVGEGVDVVHLDDSWHAIHGLRVEAAHEASGPSDGEALGPQRWHSLRFAHELLSDLSATLDERLGCVGQIEIR